MKKMVIMIVCLLGMNTLINAMEKEQKDFYIKVFSVHKNLKDRIKVVQETLKQAPNESYGQELTQITDVFEQFKLGNFIAYNAYVAPLQLHLAQLEQKVLGQQTGFGPIDQKDKRYRTEIKQNIICKIKLPEDWEKELAKGDVLQLQLPLERKEAEKIPTKQEKQKEEPRKVSFEGLPQLTLERSSSSDSISSVNSVQINDEAEDNPEWKEAQSQSQELSSDDSGQEEGSEEEYEFSNKDVQSEKQDNKNQPMQQDAKKTPITDKQDTAAPIKSDPVISKKSCCRRLLPFLASGSIIAIVAGGAGYYFCIHKCEANPENMDTQDLEIEPEAFS